MVPNLLSREISFQDQHEDTETVCEGGGCEGVCVRGGGCEGVCEGSKGVRGKERVGC